MRNDFTAHLHGRRQYCADAHSYHALPTRGFPAHFATPTYHAAAEPPPAASLLVIHHFATERLIADECLSTFSVVKELNFSVDKSST